MNAKDHSSERMRQLWEVLLVWGMRQVIHEILRFVKVEREGGNRSWPEFLEWPAELKQSCCSRRRHSLAEQQRKMVYSA